MLKMKILRVTQCIRNKGSEQLWHAGSRREVEKRVIGQEVSKLSVLCVLTDIEVTCHCGWRPKAEQDRREEASRCPQGARASKDWGACKEGRVIWKELGRKVDSSIHLWAGMAERRALPYWRGLQRELGRSLVLLRGSWRHSEWGRG